MASLLILRPKRTPSLVLVARRARFRDRLAARIGASWLDAKLAHGESPDARASLSLRARTLGEPATRTALAHDLEAVLHDARHGAKPRRGRVTIRRQDVLASSDELETLIDRLLSPGIVATRGLARVRMLLVDGSGPLYFRGAAEDLRAAAGAALSALEPNPDW
jgi:hypothetical protein